VRGNLHRCAIRCGDRLLATYAGYFIHGAAGMDCQRAILRQGCRDGETG